MISSYSIITIPGEYATVTLEIENYSSKSFTPSVEVQRIAHIRNSQGMYQLKQMTSQTATQEIKANTQQNKFVLKLPVNAKDTPPTLVTDNVIITHCITVRNSFDSTPIFVFLPLLKTLSGCGVEITGYAAFEHGKFLNSFNKYNASLPHQLMHGLWQSN